jgi:Ankyrin repeats (many copies)
MTYLTLPKMKTILAGLLILAATTFVADARIINILSFRDMEKRADLIIVGRPLSTKDTDEHSILPHIAPDIPVIGMSSEFEVSIVLKGDSSLKKVVVHHYRLANPGQPLFNGPTLASFDPTESTRYMIFLQREPDGRYAPMDQVDPVLTSIFKLNDAAWDKMKSEDFKEWMDAKKWLNERPNAGTGFSSEISAAGRGEGSLHEAALNGKLEKAKALIKADPSLVFIQQSYAQQAPLHLAAEFGRKDVAELLLANGADVEAKAYGGWTPLLQAVFGGHKDLVELLVAHKANVNYQEDAGRTPLHVAAENGYTAIAAFLLANKAEVNVKNRDGMMPLHVAVARGDKDMVELLLAANADLHAKDSSGRTPMDFAVLHNNPEMIELLKRADAPR